MPPGPAGPDAAPIWSDWHWRLVTDSGWHSPRTATRSHSDYSLSCGLSTSRVTVNQDALTFMEAFVNPRLLAAAVWRDLRARSEIVEVSVLTAKHHWQIAAAVKAQPDVLPDRVVLEPYYVIFETDLGGARGRDYLCQQLPHHPSTHTLLAHLGRATWALGIILELPSDYYPSASTTALLRLYYCPTPRAYSAALLPARLVRRGLAKRLRSLAPQDVSQQLRARGPLRQQLHNLRYAQFSLSTAAGGKRRESKGPGRPRSKRC